MAHQVQKRMTRQLAAVYEALRADPTHPSADEIYQRVRQTLPQISLGTVYRNLQRLVEEGRIHLLLVGERIARYDSMLTEHDHFICLQCGKVVDVLLDRDRQVNVAPLLEQGFTVATHSLSVHGLCLHCAQKPLKKPDKEQKVFAGNHGRGVESARLRERRER
jgi:Fur family transcriptional regulator, peroxide stress response regulator